MRYLVPVLFCFMFLFLGCRSLDMQRRAEYIQCHPELAAEQRGLILNGRLWTGMSQDEVRASLGAPYIAQKNMLKEKEVWSYKYRTSYTTHAPYDFDHILRLEFLKGRLANWYRE